MKISEVLPNDIDFVWSALRPEIQKALRVSAGHRVNESHYLESVKIGHMVMWAGHEGEQIIACGIFSIQQYPACKTLFVELLAGRNIDAWLHEVEPLLKQYRDITGATTIEALCRPGLAKKLTRWTHKSSLMELK